MGLPPIPVRQSSVPRAFPCPRARDRTLWCIHCYTNKKGRTNEKGHWGYQCPKTPYMEIPYMKKPQQSAGASGKQGIEDAAFTAKYPSLTEYLTLDSYDDGTARERSTLSVFVEGGGFKVGLNDRTSSQTLYRAGKGLNQALEALEKALATDTADWRAWKQQPRRK